MLSTNLTVLDIYRCTHLISPPLYGIRLNSFPSQWALIRTMDASRPDSWVAAPEISFISFLTVR